MEYKLWGNSIGEPHSLEHPFRTHLAPFHERSLGTTLAGHPLGHTPSWNPRWGSTFGESIRDIPLGKTALCVIPWEAPFGNPLGGTRSETALGDP